MKLNMDILKFTDTRNFTFFIYINIIHLSHLKLSETNYSYVNLKPLTYSTTYVYKRIEKVSIQSDSYNSPLWIHQEIYSLGNIQQYRTCCWSNMIQRRYLYLMNNNRLSLQKKSFYLSNKNFKKNPHLYIRIKYQNLLENWIAININEQSAFILTRKIWF